MNSTHAISLLSVIVYLVLSFMVKALYPDRFSSPGCSSSEYAYIRSPTTAADKLLFVAATPAVLIETLILDFQTTKNYEYSNFYSCVACMQKSFFRQGHFGLHPAALDEYRHQVKGIKTLATRAGLKVFDFDTLDQEFQQANELLPKLNELKSAYERTVDQILDLTQPKAKRISDLLDAAISVFGSYEYLPQPLKDLYPHNQYPAAEFDFHSPDNIFFSEEFKSVLMDLGVVHQDLLDLTEKSFRERLEVLRNAFLSKPEGRAMTKALDFILSQPCFQDFVISEVSERIQLRLLFRTSDRDDVYLVWELYSSALVDEIIYSPLSAAEDLNDMIKFIISYIDLEGVDSKYFHSPENYALLDKWAVVDEKNTFSTLVPQRPSFLKALLSSVSLEQKNYVERFDPRNAIASEKMIESPWVLGTSGQLSINLMTSIRPFHFVILSPPAATEINPSAGVKDIEIWGKSTDGRDIHLSTFTRPITSTGVDLIAVNEFSDNEVYFKSFQLVIKSNHGHPEYSKLYQFVAYGLPIDSVVPNSKSLKTQVDQRCIPEQIFMRL